MTFEDRAKIVIKQLRTDRDRLLNVLNEIQSEINTPNRGTCDSLIVDRIEKIIEYNLSEDCNKTNCLACVLNKIKRDVFNACSDHYHMPVHKLDCDEIFEIIDKYKPEGNEE